MGRNMVLGLWPSHGSRFGWVLAHSFVFSQPKMNRSGPPGRGQGLLSYLISFIELPTKVSFRDM